ncbi:MAG: methyl-accepting chemotaxis protein [Bacteroidetes bacterium]|nr:methyl-accepting chemotaxis protein [Bacteroidota bacterium]
MKRFVFSLLFCLMSFISSAQSDLLYQYSLEDGLPSSFTKQLLQLPTGEMLIATDNGLSLFNGYTFTTFSQTDGLLSQYVKVVFLDSGGKLWVGTNGGLNYAAGTSLNDGFKPFLLDQTRKELRVLALFEDSRGRIWVSSDDFFYLIDGSSVQKFGFPAGTSFSVDFVRSFEFAEDKNGGIWITTLGQGLWYLSGDQKSFTRLTAPGLDNSIRTVLPLQENRFLIGANDGLYELTVNLASPLSSTVKSLTKSVKMANRITPLDDGSFLVATDGYGNLIYNLKSNTSRQPDVLKSPYIKDVKTDRQKNVWIACDDGVYLKPHTIFKNVTTRNGLPNRYISKVIVDAKGRAFFSTYEGLFMQEKEGEKVRKLNDGDLFVRTMAPDEKNNRIVVVTGTDLYALSLTDLNLSKLIHFPFTSQPEHLFIDKTGKIWLPALNELALISPGTSEVTILGPGQGLSSSVYTAAEGPGGILYVGGDNRKLFTFDPETNRLKETDWSAYAVQPDSLDRIDEIVAGGRGRIWLGTSSGLFIFEPGKSLVKVPSDPSAPLNNIRFISAGDKEVWVGTNRFLFLISLDADGNPAGSRVFKKRNGLESTSFSNRSSFVDSKNRLWMGTNLCASYTIGGDMTYSKPEVRLYSWRTGDEEFKTGDFRNLDASTRAVTFEFYGIDYPANDLYYQTRILGLSEDWSEPTTNRIVPVNISRSGEYEFQVRASKEIGNWGPELTVKFGVETHWYYSWWMILVYILSVSGGIYLFFGWRARALQEKNAELERTISERTDAILKKDADLARLLQEMDAKGKQIYSGSLNLNENISSMTAATVQQSSSIAETTATMEELAQSNKFIEDSAMKVSHLALNNQRVLENVTHLAGQNISQMDKIRSVTEEQVHRIQSLAEKAENIKKVSLFIENVNDQTQLIAFNAAIEATLAGEIGRRFSVIADEIRNLSHEINQSTREIKQTISDMIDEMDSAVKVSRESQSAVLESVSLTREMSVSIGEMNQSQNEVTTSATSISKSTAQQTIANSQMVTSLREIADTSNHLVQSIQSISKTSHDLEAISKYFTEARKED